MSVKLHKTDLRQASLKSYAWQSQGYLSYNTHQSLTLLLQQSASAPKKNAIFSLKPVKAIENRLQLGDFSLLHKWLQKNVYAYASSISSAIGVLSNAFACGSVCCFRFFANMKIGYFLIFRSK